MLRTIFDFEVPAAYFLSIIECFEATKRDLLEENPDVPISTDDIWHEMTSQVDSLQKIQNAVAKRKKADNGVNNESSRSHLFVYIAEMKNDQQFKVIKSLTILDLGGSEALGDLHGSNSKFYFYIVKMP